MVKKTEFFLNDIGVQGIVANNSVGAYGEVLASNGSSTYWTSASSGATGFTGSQGATGFVGSQGIIGYTGSRGLADWEDNRIIAPNEVSVGQFKFGLTSWNNDNGTPYADYFHMKAYNDDTAGDDNLLSIKKTGFGLRQWQQTYNSGTPYASSVDFWHTGNDGSGSGLDADTVDGVHLSRIVYGDSDNKTTTLTDANATLPSGFYDGFDAANAPATNWWNYIMMRHSNVANHFGHQIAADFYSNDLWNRNVAGGVWGSWSKIWTSANDGSGSGLDADTVDGFHGTALVPKFTGVADATDLNTLTDSGFYRFGATVVNGPSGYAGYSNMLAISGADTMTQIYSNYTNANVWIRKGAGVSSGAWSAPSAWYMMWNSGNDGSGSGLDADLLDGYESAITSTASTIVLRDTNGHIYCKDIYAVRADTTTGVIYLNQAGTRYLYWDNSAYNLPGAQLSINGSTAWHAGNDGSGSGLDADLLDGYNTSISTTANSIPVRDVSGYTFFSYINSNTADSENPTVAQIITTNGSDNYYRKSSLDHVRRSILAQGTWLADNGGNQRIFFGTGERAYLKSASNTGTSLELRRLDDTTLATFDTSGNFVATGNVTAYSDINLKDNIQTIRQSLEKVCSMRGVTFDRKSDGTPSSGVVAQELELIAPELIHEDEYGVKSVAYGNLVGYLIEAVKELKAKVDDQELIISQFRMLR